MINIRVCVLASTCLAMSGCGSWLKDDQGRSHFRDRMGDYKQASLSEPVKIPATLDQKGLDGVEAPLPPPVKGQMIDEVPKPRAMTRIPDEPGFRLRESEGVSWLETPLPVALVRKELGGFVEDRDLAVIERSGDGARWVVSLGDSTTFDRAARSGMSRLTFGMLNPSRDRFFIQAQPGQNGRGSQVAVMHRSASRRATLETVKWQEGPDNANLNSLMMNELSSFLASVDTNDAGAPPARIAEQARLQVSGNGDLALVISDVGFGRGWNLIGGAIRGAGIKVSDVERTAGLYHILLPAKRQDTTRYLADWLTGKKRDEFEMKSYRVRVVRQGNGIRTTLEQDASTVADREVSAMVLQELRKQLGN
jgi:outer membrane protein assembly factor BamC